MPSLRQYLRGEANGEKASEALSDKLSTRLAEELGVADVVRREGFGGVTSHCGNMVRLAAERAERTLADQSKNNWVMALGLPYRSTDISSCL